MKQDNDLKEKIISDLLKTGFPLEVSVSNILNNHDWRVENSPLYIDPDDQNTRELDIYALMIYDGKQIASDASGRSIFSHLIIQCKKSSEPWIFFDNAKDDFFWLGFYSLRCEKENFMSALCSEGESIGFTTHRYKGIKRHRSFHIHNKKPNIPSKIYEALITACKALEYYKSIYSGSNTAHFYTPIIVLDGTLWSASLSDDSKINLKQVNSLVVRFDYIFGKDKKPNKYTYQFVEVITHEEFEKRLRVIETDNRSLLTAWINYLKK